MGVAVADYDNDGLPDIYVTAMAEMFFTTPGELQVLRIDRKGWSWRGRAEPGAAWEITTATGM